MKTEIDYLNPLPISVIIPTLERGSLLIQTIEDLLAQVPKPLEIIIVDQTPSYPPEIEAKLQFWKDNGAIIYEKLTVKGASVARNHGISIAKGEILLFLDDDILASKNLCLAHYRNYCPPYNYDAVAGCAPTPESGLVDELPKQYNLPQIGWMFRPMNYSRRLESLDLPTCNMSIKRKIAVAVGGFDENMMRVEDTDFSWRVHLAGAKVIYDPDACITHLVASSGAVREMLQPINEFVLGRKERWVDYFYLVMKNFGFVYGWPIVWVYIRGQIIRKIFLSHPRYLWMALSEMCQGYLMASNRLRKSPKYLR